MDFIIDRTNEDVMFAQTFINAVWSKMTNAQKQEWLKGINSPLESLKGFFNYTDMRRIKDNYNSLISIYDYSGEKILNTYNMGTVPNRTQMSSNFEKVKNFVSAYPPYLVGASFVDYRTPTELSVDVNKMDYNFLNNYEHALKNLYDLNDSGELIMECEFLGTDSYELDGYVKGVANDYIRITIPSGFIVTREMGTYSPETHIFTPEFSDTWKTDGETKSTRFLYIAQYLNFRIESGIKDVIGYGRVSRTIDVANYDNIKFDSPIEIEYPSITYTAESVQSDFVDISNKDYAWFYNASNTSGRIIVTLYDELQDEVEEIAITEDTLITFNGASYFTIDSEVGDSIEYARQTDLTQTWNCFGVSSGNSTYIGAISSGATFDVSNYETVNISRSTTQVNNNLVARAQVDINNGKRLSELDTGQIKIKYEKSV